MSTDTNSPDFTPQTPTQVQSEYLVVFIGNPNVGKTALINALSGSRLKVGNWAGVTVEKKEALLQTDDFSLRLLDLPGTYSLNPYTLEERISHDFFKEQRPDLIINVIDAPNFERNLQLTSALLDLECPILVAFNMWDELIESGHHIDLPLFEQLSGLKAMPTSAVQEQGIAELKDAILAHLKASPPAVLDYGKEIEFHIKETQMPRWQALQSLEKPALIDALKTRQRAWQNQISKQTWQAPETPRTSASDQLDRFLLNPWTGLPAFFALLYAVFKLTFDLSGPFIDWIDGFFNGFLALWVQGGLAALGLPEVVTSLIKDGLIGGVGLVLTFVPVLFFLYMFLALLEESGYMARAAFLMDRFMYRFGLHGKAFVPLLVGFGCNVPAVYATRALEKESERKITVAVMSFMSCGAKLPIYALFTAVFFQKNQALVILGLYLLGIAVAIFWAIVLRKTRYKDEIPAFMMELPPYRWPQAKMLWVSVWGKTRAFVQQAGTVIAVSMILLWGLVNFPYGAPPEKTLLGRSAQVVAPVFTPLGFGHRWEPAASVIPGFMAKEMVVGTLGVVLSVQVDDPPSENTSFWAALWAQVVGLKDACWTAIQTVLASILPSTFVMEAPAEKSPLTQAVGEVFTPLSAFSYMVFNLLLLSCISVVGAVTHEFGSRFFFFVLTLTSGTAYVVSMLVYQTGRLLF